MTSPSFAQDPPSQLLQILEVDSYPFEELSLSSQDSVILESIKDSPDYLDGWVVKVDDIANHILDGSRLNIQLPDWLYEEDSLGISDFQYKDNYNWKLHARTLNGDTLTSSFSDLFIIRQEGKIMGSFTSDSGMYEIQPLASNDSMQFLLKVDHLRNIGLCGLEDDLEGYETDTTGSYALSGSVCVVEVLALITPAARAQDPNINHRIDLAIYQGEQLFRNSHVLNKKYRLVGKQDVNLIERSDDIEGDIDLWSADQDLNNLREQLNADLVVILTADIYDDLYGLAEDVGVDDDVAFCIVSVGPASTGRFTFNHELGYLIGLRHQFDASGTFNHGYAFSTKKWFLGRKNWHYTLMATVVVGGSRLGNFSNPDVHYAGKPTGTHDWSNNARKAQETFCTVRDFRSGNMAMVADLVGPSRAACPCNSYSIYVQVEGGFAAPLTYEWYESSTGTSYSHVQSGGVSHSVDKPCNFGERIYAKVVVTDDNNQLAEAYWSDFPTSGMMLPPCQNRIGYEEAPLKAILQSNGSNDPILILENLYQDISNSVQLVDMLGRKHQMNGTVRGSTTNINFINLPPGLYTVRIASKGKTQAIRILKGAQ